MPFKYLKDIYKHPRHPSTKNIKTPLFFLICNSQKSNKLQT